MQNFTFGRKGLNWFLFAFILFVGNLSASYAQNCPTLDPGDDTQNFCYLSRVSDLQANPNGDGLSWYRTATSTTPIPSEEILQDGSYFAGNNSGDCASREEVVVTVDDLGPPVSSFGNFYEPCEYSSDDVTTVAELKALISTTGSADDLNVYDQSQEFGTVELDDTDVLVEGRSYFVGQDDTSTSCEYSSRLAIKYDPILATAPSASANQTLCEDSTISDLEAEGINRWYSTETSNPALDPSTPLVDGQTYYASRIVNRTNSSLPPCESQDRTAVTVTLVGPPDAGEDNTGVVCFPDVGTTFPSEDAIRNYLLNLLEPGVSRSGTFSPSISQLVNIYGSDDDGLGDFTTTYTIGSGACQDSVDLTISVIEETPANAGDFDDLTDICTGDAVIDLATLINNDSDATAGGTFTGTGVTDNEFDPSTGAGDYTITYMVDETSAPCTIGNDSTEFIVSVRNGDAGDDSTVTLSPSDDPINLFDFLNGTPDMGGTWSPGDGTFDPTTDTPGDFTYSVDNACGTDSATVTVIVNECATPPDAGSDNVGIVCLADVPATFPSIDETRKYFLNLLDDGVATNGTFSPSIDDIVDIYQDDEDGLGDFTITYTIGTVDCQDSVDLTVRVVEEAPANAGSFDDIADVCSDEDMIDLSDLPNNDPDFSMGGTFSGEGVTDNMFDPSIGEGTYTITYSVDDSTPCVIGEDSTTFTITVDDAPVTTNIERILCITEAETLLTDEIALQIFLNDLLTDAGVDTVDPAGFDADDLAEGMRLLDFVDDPDSDSETFNFSYLDESTSSSCDDGIINIAITINDLQDAEAGTIDDQNVCVSDGMIDLTMFLGADSMTGGTFSGDNVTDGMFDTSVGSNDDGYTVTYNVDDSADCVTPGTTDSETFTIFVDDTVDAGEDNSGDVCRENVSDLFPNNSSVRRYYLSLLSDGVSEDGVFNPTIQDVIDAYNTNPDQEAFTTTYTISNGGCSDSVELTINIYDSIPAEIGDITDPDPICRNAEDVDLYSFLPADANPNGTFEGYEDGIFSPTMEGEGSFEITYTLTDDSPCTEGEASATFTVTVIESAFAGMDMDLNVCMDAGVQDLFGFLSEDADTNGEFTLDGNVISDGMMDPADFAAGDYEVIYTVPEINDCGADTATFNITVEDAPGAPTVDGNPFTFCATDAATVADLSATGTNLTFYSDADLTMMVAAEDALETGSYYVTQRNDDGSCESAAAEITVTINDADTPTIANSTQEFCEYDDATVANLTDAVNETDNITWYDSADGDNALNGGTPLQNGVTYYATLFNVETGCESSVRLAVTVNITDCPLLFPEGFSPNGDGINDTFDIENIEDEYPNYTIEIYNRWGDSVYKGNANTPDWDGFSSESSLGDNVLPAGVYFYYLDFNDGSTEPRRGKVYLSR
ncbi:gliding motility-associated C-terminal domain-containing protein [Gramella lutea]|uniref:Gliding motility-associated C-terminal domain-containing protein n=1 Tax=Christiangramia lutea TaxID=1607951 RepID=A0A9X2AC12_9FLAO|nr:gliding motility-associated C-terminal domain-containing protein [Christiangramia lutea]MCH4823947.1 gliding motility-associated C-terminal domain-containing protein [Christiangramia lutea]